jgi:hypothetical protein
VNRRAATLLVLLAACAQPPIALPPPLPEDCGLSAEDRAWLANWEQRQIGVMIEIDALAPDQVADEYWPGIARRSVCERHGTPLQRLPARAEQGLRADEGSLDWYSDDFPLSLWDSFHGPPRDHSAWTVPVGCELRGPYVLTRACEQCRCEYRRWGREYVAQRAQHLRDHPASLAEWNRAYEASFPELRAPASEQD